MADPTLDLPFETQPDAYKHWKLSFDGELATLSMDVSEDGGLGDYVLKQNSYDLGVDIELADALMRIRFEHPEVKTVIVTGLKEKIFCAGANIFMLGGSSHPFKVNFCKYTNETRLYLEDASEHSGLKFLCALNGTAAGGGYELALACDQILLIDDRNSAVSLPEVPLLGVLPGTGGLTRVVDKRKVRRDLADVFSTVAEGVKGKRAVDWKLVDGIVPKSKWEESVKEKALELAQQSDRPGGEGVHLAPLSPTMDGDSIDYEFVQLSVDKGRRTAELLVKGPFEVQPSTPDSMRNRGTNLWSLRCFRELDDALLRLRLQHLDVGLVTLRTAGNPTLLLDAEQALLEAAKTDWFAREVLLHQKRVMKRLDVTSRTFVALVEPGSCFAGSFAEFLWAADRSYMLDDPESDTEAQVFVGEMSFGPLPMPNNLTRLQTRFLDDEDSIKAVRAHVAERTPIGPEEAEKLGIVTYVRDDIDFPDEVRLFTEERSSLSPDALTGMEANLRFAGPETMETKIFGRLSAWQNWIFTRPNATGEKGALSLYGSPERPAFDMRRC